MPDYEFYNGQHTGSEVDQGVEAALQMRKVSGIIKSDGNGTISPATQGEDFVAPVTGATQGNFAAFDATGNPVDSGKQPSDFTSRPTVSVVTMSAANWQNDTYSFETEYPHANYDIRISIASTASEGEYDAFCEAKICGNADANTYTAKGTAPSLNIPIMLEVYPK